ncbi:alcohol oxidase [Apiospora arundinis]|uniref:Alcohol oxidase n=1 Tax=Apiospora arundinis TaxID=335852 RepID=A0ABR2IRX6_9PEZI
MWPFSSYPVYSPSDVQGKTYDYVIVGGGTAGCVVAARLSEDPGASVLVIDKGHVRDNMVSRIPLVSQNMFLGDLLQVQGDRWTEPMPGANRRRNRLWAVEGIGGASCMNAMLWTPHPGSKARGHEGPIEMRRVTFPFAWTEYFRKAAQELGLRTGKDINDPVAAPALGFFDLDVAIDGRGNRISALTAYLNKEVVWQRRDRLTVCTGGVASRLEADAKTGIVTGVHIRSSDNTDGEFLVKARREVIICAGAACTPQLLLLSGIGPAASSEKHGIPLIKELPGVGATLSDHYSTPIMLEVPKKEAFHLLESVLGIWHFLLWLVFGKGYMSIGSMSSTMYLRSGAVNKTTMQIQDRDDAGRDNQDASLSRNVPDIEIMLMPNSAVEREVKGRTLMSIYPTLVQPRGSGRVELASTDALAQPWMTYPMFTNEHDISTARLAVRFSMRLAEKLQNSDYPYPAKLVFAPGQDGAALEEWEKAAPVDYLPIPMPLPPSVQAHPSPQDAPKSKEAVSGEDETWRTWSTVTDDEIDDYMKRVSHTSLHFSGTCPMSNDEKTGVVDQQLPVYGFTNLRIADTSVFPKIPSCHTMAPVMAVAEDVPS